MKPSLQYPDAKKNQQIKTACRLSRIGCHLTLQSRPRHAARHSLTFLSLLLPGAKPSWGYITVLTVLVQRSGWTAVTCVGTWPGHWWTTLNGCLVTLNALDCTTLTSTTRVVRALPKHRPSSTPTSSETTHLSALLNYSSILLMCFNFVLTYFSSVSIFFVNHCLFQFV